MIDPHRHYRPSAQEMREVASQQTLARWRHEGRGPAYVKSGSMVLYRGQDVLDWLASHRVAPEERRP